MALPPLRSVALILGSATVAASLTACTPSSSPSAAPSASSTSAASQAAQSTATTDPSVPGQSPMPSVPTVSETPEPSTRVSGGYLVGTGWKFQIPAGWAEREVLDMTDAAVFFGQTEDSLYGDLPQQVTTTDPKAFRDAFGGKMLPDRTIGGEKAYGVEVQLEGRYHRLYAMGHKGKLHVVGLVSETADLSQYDAAFAQACDTFVFTA